jgi:hypothetical protein
MLQVNNTPFCTCCRALVCFGLYSQMTTFCVIQDIDQRRINLAYPASRNFFLGADTKMSIVCLFYGSSWHTLHHWRLNLLIFWIMFVLQDLRFPLHLFIMRVKPGTSTIADQSEHTAQMDQVPLDSVRRGVTECFSIWKKQLKKGRLLWLTAQQCCDQC